MFNLVFNFTKFQIAHSISVILTLDFTSFLLTVHYVRKYTRNTWTSVVLTLHKHCSEALLNQVAES